MELQNWKADCPIVPREEAVCQTIERCKDVYFHQEQNRLLTCGEFLWSQLQYTRKRWWALQAALLILAWQILPIMDSRFYRMRSMGVFGCLFVILIIPELWRNRESDAVQVEAACLYSLRQIYAARITLFGMVDVTLLTLFCLCLGRMGFTLTEVLSQFLLPATVTAGICFSLFCRNAAVGEITSLSACLSWCGAWWLILMNEHIYLKILPSVWTVLFALALAFLVLAVRRAVRTTSQHWEVAFF